METALATSTSHSTVMNSFVRVLEDMGLTDVTVNNAQDMMGGHLCTVETDHIGLLGDIPHVEIVETSIRDRCFWHAVKGSVFRRGRNVALQGEWGTYGEMSDAPEVLRLQVWMGRFAVPEDVRNAFALEHDRLIARGAANRLYVAASQLDAVADEALLHAATREMTDMISRQTARLARAN